MPTAPQLTKAALTAGLLGLGLSCVQDYEITGERPDVDPGDVTDCGFTNVAGTDMYAYDCNPVFSSTDESWGQTVGSVGFLATDVLGHPFYQMWYTASPEAGGSPAYGMGYAVSGNGVDWETHNANPLFVQDPMAWDSDGVASQVAVWDADFGQYVMAYQGFTIGDGGFDPGIWGLGVATSPDGVVWTKHPWNPVIDFQALGATNGISPCWPMTITKATGGFRGYISAQEVDPFLGIPLSDVCNIYPMTAIDPGVWTVGTNQVLSAGMSGSDTKGMTGAAVVEHNGIQYMFYIGFTGWIAATGYQYTDNMTLNLATSIDGGITWAKDPNNPLPINLTNPGLVTSVSAQLINDRIHLWVGDVYESLGAEGQGAIGYFYYDLGGDEVLSEE